MNDDEKVHQAIWDQLPELRDALVQYERQEVLDSLENGLEPNLGAYALITDVLVRPYVLPLLDKESLDSAALTRCSHAIEQILDGSDSYLQNAIGIRLVEHMLRKPERWRHFRAYAGPLLQQQVVKSSPYFAWPYDEPVV